MVPRNDVKNTNPVFIRTEYSWDMNPVHKCAAIHGLGTRQCGVTMALTEGLAGIPFNSAFTSSPYGFLWPLAPISELKTLNVF